MAKRSHHSATQGIRAWTSEQVQKVLADNGLEECCEAIKKRSVDGDTFLTLTEGQLALWKRDISLPTIKKLARFVQEVVTNPEKYVHILPATTTQNVDIPPAIPHLPLSPPGNYSPLSDNGSWDTDFDDDMVSSPVSAQPSEYIDEEVEYANDEVVEILQKPPIPVRPLIIPSKPVKSVSPTAFNLPIPEIIPPVAVNSPDEEDGVEYTNNEVMEIIEKSRSPSPARPLAPPSKPGQSVSPPVCNLPKPPVLLEDNFYGHVKTLVNDLDLDNNANEFDEEDYESLNESLALKLKRSLEEHARANQLPPTTQSSLNIIKYAELAQNSSTFPPRPPKKQPEEEITPQESVDEHLEGGVYEAVNDQTGAPPLPVKVWNKPQLPNVPSASPPRKKSDDSSSSQGNSGDGMAWGLSEFFRKKFLSPTNNNPPETRERTPTPELKKTPTISHKPPPPVDVRPSTFPNNHRPLPPTPEDSKTNRSRKTSKVSLTQQPWYHNVDRKQGEVLLRTGEDGCFLVRPSAQSQNALTLMLWFNKRLYNINIRHRTDGRYALGTEKQNEQSFSSVEELVQNYQSEKLVLYSGGERERASRTLLTSSPPQSSEPTA